MSDNNILHCGIMGMGTYVPNKHMTAQEIATAANIPLDVIINKFGINKKVIADDNCMPGAMAIIAAKKAIKNAKIDPLEIDIVVWAGSQHKGHIMWLAGVDIAQTLGAKNAWSFDISSMCSSIMTGIEVSKSLLLTNPECKTVLLVSGSRDHDFVNLADADSSFLFNMGAGGSALVIRKNFNKNIIYSSAFKTDGSFAKSCLVQNKKNKSYFTIEDNEVFKERLKTVTMKNFIYVIRSAVEKSGLKISDINYLAMLHIHKAAHDACLQELNLDNHHTTYLNEYGHMSQNDQILSMEIGLQNGKIKNGSNIVLVGAGIGFVWAATVINWGTPKTQL